MFYKKSSYHAGGFTLIELLIVVAIIAILAAIAVPNFLEAQVRSKISRCKADMRSQLLAIEAYRVDSGKVPPARNPSTLSWWGFVPTLITTPVAYMTSTPNMPFFDKGVVDVWKVFYAGSYGNQPYTYVYDTTVIREQRKGIMSIYSAAPANIPRNLKGEDATDFFQQAQRAGYIVYSCGPDSADGTVNGGMMTYDPTNGTISFGDIYAFGAGTASDSAKAKY